MVAGRGPATWKSSFPAFQIGSRAHDVSMLIVTIGAVGRYRGVEPRSKVSMMIMRPPQHGHGCGRVGGSVVSAPAASSGFILAFGAALSEIQEIVGKHFAVRQGGSAWTSPAVGQLAAKMKAAGATGIGQSSWGPTGFAFVDSPQSADRLYHSIVGDAKANRLDIVIARGRNSPALIGVA